MNERRFVRRAAMLGLITAFAACGGGEKKAPDTAAPAAPPSGAAPTPAPAAPAPGGKTITIEMITDETGNYFKPKDIEVHRGDMLHFVVTTGVHNVHFLPDSNTIKTGLPAASDLLQLPGQAYDLVINFEPGVYYFQCDPHAALGMKGHLKVEKE